MATGTRAGRHIIDLGEAWQAMTGLPFVFATWIVRDGLDGRRCAALSALWRELMAIKAELPQRLPELVAAGDALEWITPAALTDYLRGVSYDLGPNRQASLVLFGRLCQELGLIDATPGLRWQSV